MDVLVKRILDIILEKGGIDPVYIPLGIHGLAENFVIASGTSRPHLLTLCDAVQKICKAEGIPCTSEGHQKGEWLACDVGFIVVHLLKPELRSLYQLEELHRFPYQESM